MADTTTETPTTGAVAPTPGPVADAPASSEAGKEAGTAGASAGDESKASGAGEAAASTAASASAPVVDFNAADFLSEPRLRIRYKQARQLLRQDKLEEASEMFGALLQAVCVACRVHSTAHVLGTGAGYRACCRPHTPHAPVTCASLLGVLTRVEANGELSEVAAPLYYQYGLSLLGQVQNSSDAFGGAVRKQDGTPGTAPPEEASDRADTIEIAWQVLDVARVVYSKQDGKVCGGVTVVGTVAVLGETRVRGVRVGLTMPCDGAPRCCVGRLRAGRGTAAGLRPLCPG